MKKHLIIGIVILLICVNLSGCNTPKHYISADRVDEEPDVYINITEQQIKNYPHLKKAIESEGESIEIPEEENDKVWLLLENKDIDFIKYKDEYYEISFTIVCL